MTSQQSHSISQIDWYLDDGVNVPMLNDILRNRFYDNILSTGLTRARCVDIGFGTGLLSILALKHGADHVVAFEKDLNRYHLGQQIIQDLGLENQIELHHGMFQHSDFVQYRDRVIITETVNDSMLQEGLWNILPRTSGHDFRPGQYFMDLHVIPIPHAVAELMGAESNDPKPFHPGVDIRPDFVQAVNRYRNLGCSPEYTAVSPVSIQPGVNYFDYRIDTMWNWTPHLALARSTQPDAGYEINAESNLLTTWNRGGSTHQPIVFDHDTIKVTVPLTPYHGSTLLVVPRFGLRHDQHVLYLDTGHWGAAAAPVILHRYPDQLTVEQHVFSSEIAYCI